MSTTRVRDILNEIEERGSDLNVCPAEDVFGPGGGVYITRVTPLNLKTSNGWKGVQQGPQHPTPATLRQRVGATLGLHDWFRHRWAGVAGLIRPFSSTCLA